MAAFGLETLYKAHKSEISNSFDAVVCGVHWCLVSHGLRSIGVGEIPDADAESSELLPSGWNVQGDVGVYSILYRRQNANENFVCKCVMMDDALFINLMRLDGSEIVGSCNIFVDEYCTGDLSSFKQAFRNLTTLQSLVENDVLKPVGIIATAATSQATSSRQNQSTQQAPRRDVDNDPLRVPPRQPPQQTWPFGQEDPFSVGRADLDPLAGGIGGGMIMDPMRGGPSFGVNPMQPNVPGRLPPGAVPPGARFDPMFPETGAGRGRGGPRAGPDPDHMRPPPDYDDMFG